jgi:hypothetical protein
MEVFNLCGLWICLGAGLCVNNSLHERLLKNGVDRLA